MEEGKISGEGTGTETGTGVFVRFSVQSVHRSPSKVKSPSFSSVVPLPTVLSREAFTITSRVTFHA